MTRLPPYMLLVVMLVSPTLSRAIPEGFCNFHFCDCRPAEHPKWVNINCTVPPQQALSMYIRDGDLPPVTSNLVINGAQVVTFEANSLSALEDVRKIHIQGCSTVILKKSAAVRLNLLRGLLDIENCEDVRIENNTFVNIKGPLSVNITNCNRASLEGAAFSWLLEMNISNVRELSLGPESFMRDITVNSGSNVHGPDMKIELKNVTIQKIPSQTFGHSAAKIYMESVKVDKICSDAFSGNTLSNVTATDCIIKRIDGESFSAKTQIDYLNFQSCMVHELGSKALLSAVTNLNISESRFDKVETGAISATVVSVAMLDNQFHKFNENGFELSSLNKLQMERNSFDELPQNAIVAPDASIDMLWFVDNEIETIYPGSLGFIGQARKHNDIVYKKNYFGRACYCNITQALDKAMNIEDSEFYSKESYCTVDEFVARCFNVLDQNMQLKRFIDGMCEAENIKCENYEAKTEVKNPRFPHKTPEDEGVSERNKKVIGIVIVTILGCVIIVMFVSLIKWMRRKGYFENIKDFLISSNSTCGAFCDRICVCHWDNDLDNAGSISQLSVNEYSERHRLNEPRHDIQETVLPEAYAEVPSNAEDKTTQTLPEELTKELLENLKNKLEDPENYVEAREMIEHLYELIKVEESCNNTNSRNKKTEENIYELPFQNTAPRIGRNKKKMVSVGTRTPSLDKLLPFSPYNRQTALAHEYFEPKDFAVHLYAEIANSDREKRTLLGAIPDVVAEQAIPRGPYLRAVRDKMTISSPSSSTTPYSGSSFSPASVSPIVSPHMSIKSNKSTSSNSSSKMVNRPLPEKPASLDPGEGPSYQSD